MIPSDIVFGGLGILLPLTIDVFGYQVFYKYITQKEAEVKKRVKEDITAKINQYKTIVRAKGLNDYIDDLTMTIEVEYLITDGKESFEKWMLWTTIVGIISSMLYLAQVTISTFSPDFFKALAILVFLFFLSHLNRLYNSKTKVDKYLSGTPPEKIFDEE